MLTDAIFSPNTLLWLAGALIAFFLLIGSMSQRRISLTELLRRYVSKNQNDFRQTALDEGKKKPKSKTKKPPQ